NGILNVRARDKGTGREQKVTIQTSSGLTEAEVERMRKEAEKFAAEDKERRALVELRNQADQLAYQVEKTVRDAGDKIEAGVKADIEAKVEKVRQAIKGDDRAAIEAAMSELQQAMHKVSEALYQQGAGAAAGAGSGPTGGKASGKGDEDIKDADFEVR